MPKFNRVLTKKKASTIRHINYALVFKTHSPMYKMHKFWSRKPANIVSEYINIYSQPNDVVLDPFCGSGTTATEALKRGRKAIAIDYDPIATFVTRMTAMPVNIEKLDEVFELLSTNVKDKVVSLYKIACPACNTPNSAISKSLIISGIVECPSCKHDIVMMYAKRSPGTRQNAYLCTNTACTKPFLLSSLGMKGEAYMELKYECLACLSKGTIKNPSAEYIRKSPKTISYWYPKLQLRYKNTKSFKTKRRGETLESLYTKTNLEALSILYHEITEIQNKAIRELMLFTFSSMLHLTSKLIMLKRGKEAGWNVPEYLLTAFYPEYNVWDRFESRFKAIKRGKIESNTLIKSYKEVNRLDELYKLKHPGLFISKQSATDLSNIENNSIDYVFTDPPYGGIVQYYELDLLRSAWLAGSNIDPEFQSFWEDEITINSSQGKDGNYYHGRLHTAFREIFRVLKPGKYMTVTFHNKEIAIYNSIIRATIFAGFELEKILYQPTDHISSKAGFHPYTSIEGDFYLRFRKPMKGELVSSIDEREVDERRAKSIIKLIITKILVQRGQPTTFTELLKGQSNVYDELRKMGYLFFGANPENIEQVLNENSESDFVFLNGEGWWLKEPNRHHPNVPLNDRVEEAVLQRLRRATSTFDGIIQEIYLNFTNSLTPNPASITSIIEEYGERTEESKWRLKPEVSSAINQHSTMIAHLATLGREFGYDVWIGVRERPEIYNGKELSTYSNLSELKLKGSTQDQIDDYLKQIDVLWIKKGEPYFAIEVEYSTAITEAFNRCSNLPDTGRSINRIIIIPKQRENMLQRKLNSALLKERMEQDQWKFIHFDKFIDFFLHSRSTKIHESNFLTLANQRDLSKEIEENPQHSIEEYFKDDPSSNI